MAKPVMSKHLSGRGESGANLLILHGGMSLLVQHYSWRNPSSACMVGRMNVAVVALRCYDIQNENKFSGHEMDCLSCELDTPRLQTPPKTQHSSWQSCKAHLVWFPM